MTIPSVFISYSHDTQEHKKWVLDLATRLRNTGIDAALDQWDLKPGDDLPHFMEQNLVSSDYVIMICTEKYVSKANSGVGGVGYEKMIITSDLLTKIDSNKIIPIIRQEGTADVPTFLKTKLYVNFSRDDEFEFSYDELVRTIHNAPLYKKPEVANNPFEPITDGKQEKTNDAVYELMAIVIHYFESGHDYVQYKDLIGKIGKSRVMLDMIIREAVEKGYVTQASTKSLFLKEKGKFYAVDHKLVEV
ncbi:toll/interleukin-1 receptor domain-containing protein [Desulfobacula phenolica]|uniref:SEFIR domain-containing protein n=1 Tax=Desulfobacula phenolica TaxID=90732 RepID=A0A1H2KFB0_9BACT|nr:toll/interleukin-1 receptor domain-containing protein [Desulfobacula phenolica]SDU67420.1 SEFIR domain-containing protein [Desulfobacula phenolica]